MSARYVYPVTLSPSERGYLDRLHEATGSIPRGTLLRGLIRMSLPEAMERPESLKAHLGRKPRIDAPAHLTTLTELVGHFRSGRLQLSIPWSYSDPWDSDQKQRFVEHVESGFPLSEFWIVGTPRDGLLVDGVQRLRALSELSDEALSELDGYCVVYRSLPNGIVGQAMREILGGAQ